MSSSLIRPLLIFIGVSSALVISSTLIFYHQELSTLFLTYGIVLPWFVFPLISLIVTLVISFRFSVQFFENDKLKHDFVTIVTHKFRTPITGMKWALDNLKDDRLTQQERIDILRKMEQSIDRLIEIVDVMVGASKFDRRLGYMHEVASIRVMVEQSLQKYSELVRSKNIIFRIDTGNAIPNIIIDKRKLQFAIDVLVENAIVYTSKGGTIHISFEQVKDRVIFKITDSGIGFSFFDRKRIFSQFYRTAEARHVDTEGMGLGLFTAKQITEAHGGRLWAESKGKSKGATFYMELKAEI